METSAEMIASCAPGELCAYVADLDRYPQWLGGLVHAAEREPDSDGRAPAWRVELRSRLGPMARSKTLRMVRTEFVPDHLAVFERVETDGRHHAVWRLRAEVWPVESPRGSSGGADASRLLMTLTYEGSLWTGGLLERVLRDQIEAGRDRLLEILSAPTH